MVTVDWRPPKRRFEPKKNPFRVRVSCNRCKFFSPHRMRQLFGQEYQLFHGNITGEMNLQFTQQSETSSIPISSWRESRPRRHYFLQYVTMLNFNFFNYCANFQLKNDTQKCLICPVIMSISVGFVTHKLIALCAITTNRFCNSRPTSHDAGKLCILLKGNGNLGPFSRRTDSVIVLLRPTPPKA